MVLKNNIEFQDIFVNMCCNRSYKKKYFDLKKSGYKVNKPKDYNGENYGYIKTHGIFDVGFYYKYGPKWVLEENGKVTYYNY